MNNQIVDAALTKCQELLRQIAQEASGSPILGIAPSRCYAVLLGDYVSSPRPSPLVLFTSTNQKPVRNWVFGVDYLRELVDMNERPVFDPINKAFFHEGIFVIAVSGDGGRCQIDFQVGPRYGTCSVYDVHLEDGEYALNQVAITRVS
jgi:hypothetical protein